MQTAWLPLRLIWPCASIVFLTALPASVFAAQEPEQPPSPQQQEQPQQPQEPQETGADALRVFLDCDECDTDFLRTELTFVNYVRDRMDAQVHVLVTEEDTGGGGEAVTIDFVGLEAFAGMEDQIVYFISQDDTDDDERRMLAQRLALGLARFAAGTPLADRMAVAFEAVEGEAAAAQPQDDPWNFWVFRTEVEAELDGEERESSKQFGGSFSANRTTDQWIMNFGLDAEIEEERFELSDGGTFSSTSRDHAFTARAIKSLGDHWGAGVGGSIITTTFRNLDLATRIAPAIEYNFFPYTQSTRRQFTLRYAVGIDRFNYEEETIFEKMSETRTSHSFVATLDVNEPWGASELAVETAQFLDDASQYRVVFSGEIEIRLFRGFFLDVSGNTSRVRDQIYLPRRGATDEEILVQLRQLATGYEYGFRLGIGYSFGSIYNNVVNSRFAGSESGFIRTF